MRYQFSRLGAFCDVAVCGSCCTARASAACLGVAKHRLPTADTCGRHKHAPMFSLQFSLCAWELVAREILHENSKPSMTCLGTTPGKWLSRPRVLEGHVEGAREITPRAKQLTRGKALLEAL